MDTPPASLAELFSTAGLQPDVVEKELFGRLREEIFGVAPEPIRLGRLVVLEKLGQGGMGVVYAAYDPKLDRRVAVKLLHHRGRRATDRTLREAKALARITHPNVVVVHDAQEFDERVAIVMEYIDGRSLRGWAREARPWRDVVACFVAAGHGLEAAHSADVVHGDFKPDNVLIGTDGRPRVADFGLAVSGVPTDASPTNEPGATRGGGTPGYAAPEQVAGEPVDARTDQFSFCVALWEALTRERPFSVAELESAGTVAPSRASELPRPVRRALERGLQMRPADRFESMTPLLRALTASTRLRWGRVLFPVSVLGVGVVGGVLLVAEPGCGEASTLNESWASARHGVRAAIEATGSALAPDATTRVDEALRAHSGRWFEAYRRACASDESLVTRAYVIACLEDDARRFQALVDALGEVERAELGRVVEATVRLDDPGRCARRARPDIEPPTVGQEPAVAEIRELIATSDVSLDLGRYDVAAAQASAALERARPLGYAPVLAEAQYRLGRASLSRLDDAEAHLTEAVWTAYAARHHALQGIAASTLAVHFALKRSQPQVAWIYARMAAEAATIEGSSRTASAAERAAAIAAYASDDIVAALGHYERSVELRREAEGDGHPGVGITLGRVGRMLAELGRLDEARDAYAEALGILSTAFGPDHPEVASTLAMRAEMLVSTGEVDVAVADLRRAVAILERTFGPRHEEVGATLGRLARALYAAEENEVALETYERALEIEAAVLGDHSPELVSTLNNMASVLRRMARQDEAEAKYRRALAILQRAHVADGFDAAPILSNLAGMAQERGDTEEAKRLHGRALAILASSDAAPPVTRLALRTSAAMSARMRGDAASAREILVRALADAEAADVAPVRRINAMVVLANSTLTLGDRDEARKIIERAYALRDTPGVSLRNQATLHDVYAFVLEAFDERAEARAYYRKASELYTRAGPGHATAAAAAHQRAEAK